MRSTAMLALNEVLESPSEAVGFVTPYLDDVQGASTRTTRRRASPLRPTGNLRMQDNFSFSTVTADQMRK